MIINWLVRKLVSRSLYDLRNNGLDNTLCGMAGNTGGDVCTLEVDEMSCEAINGIIYIVAFIIPSVIALVSWRRLK